MENNNLELILDTSALIHLYFGSYNTSRKIRKQITSYEKIHITNIIRFEFRNIFLDFFRFIEIYKSLIIKIQENELFIVKIFPELLEEISRKYHRREHQFGRMRIIYEGMLEEYQKKTMEIMVKGLNNSENIKEILIDRLKTLIWDFKIKLKNVYDDLTNYNILNDFECFLRNWEYFYDAKNDEFAINEKSTCSQICSDIGKKILSFIHINQEFIDQILEKYLELSKTKNITNYDKRLITALQNIVHDKNYKIGIRDCKKLGDLYISSVIKQNRNILTRNKAHFMLLLLCKNREKSLILF